MIVAMQGTATPAQIQHVIELMVELGFNVHRTTGVNQTILAGVGGTPGHFDIGDFAVLPGVEKAYRISSPYKLAGRGFRPEGTQITFPNGVVVGGTQITIMAGPCSVESREQILLSAKLVKAAGCQFLRGGAFKPRSSPYSFQGMGLDGLKLLREVSNETGPARHHRSHGALADRAPCCPTSIASRSARATCRTSTCSASSATCASPC